MQEAMRHFQGFQGEPEPFLKENVNFNTLWPLPARASQLEMLLTTPGGNEQRGLKRKKGTSKGHFFWLWLAGWLALAGSGHVLPSLNRDKMRPNIIS